MVVSSGAAKFKSWIESKVEMIGKIESELLEDCEKINEIILSAREKIQRHINTIDNLEGCLSGTVEDYLVTYGEQIERMKNQFNVDRRKW